MTKAATLTLIGQIDAVSQRDTTQVQDYYDDVVYELVAQGINSQQNSITSTAGDDTYSYSHADTLHMICLNVRDTTDRQLDRIRFMDQESIETDWLDLANGTPFVYTEGLDDDRTFRVIPAPDTSSATYFEVLDARYADDIRVWVELPIALEVVAREFSRESEHRDAEYAEACHGLASLLFEGMGFSVGERQRGRG